MTARRVALVVGQLHVGGAERQLFELARHLDRSRHEPLVVCLSRVVDPYAGRLREAGVEVAVLPRRRSGDPFRVAALAVFLRRRRVDLAHSFLLAANAYTWAASRLAGGVPYIASSRTCIPPVGRWRWRVHQRAFRAASAIVANARNVAEFTRALYGLPSGRLHVIPNGVPIERFARGAGREAARGRWGIPADALVVGTLGRLSAEKNLELFLRMASRVASNDPGMRTRFLVVGDGPVRSELGALSTRLELDGRVLFAGEQADVPAAMAAMDLFVLTSDTEGMPNAVMEAMASSLPVVATRVGGTPELVEDGLTGRLVPRGDLETLCERVVSLLEDAATRGRMGEAGREKMAREYSVAAMVSATSRLYDEVAG